MKEGEKEATKKVVKTKHQIRWWEQILVITRNENR